MSERYSSDSNCRNPDRVTPGGWVALNAIKDCVVMLPFGFEKLGFFVRQ